MCFFVDRLNSLVWGIIGLGLVLACAVSGIQIDAHAQTDESGRYKQDGYKYEKPQAWNELDVVLPLPPQKNQFSLFQTTSQSGFQFFVDVSSIQLGEDGVVRMVLLTVSPKGSENITYEGFRCETAEYKFYASSFGFDKAWMPVKNPQWRGAFYQTANGYRGDLLKYYICIYGANLLDERQLKAFFKKGKMHKSKGRGSR
jgi:hypothetical protein